MHVIEAITGRKSIRAYAEQAVPTSVVRAILDTARWAPSGVNAQPWRVAVVQAHTKQRISAALLDARSKGQAANPDYQYYPTQWHEPYRNRRIDCGKALYAALNISREDKTRQMQAWDNNYHFFGAPCGLFFWVDKSLEKGSWVDMGMFIQNVMLAARSHGLETCPQAALAEFPDIVRAILGVEDSFALICGMSLGYPDLNQPVNGYRLSRVAVEDFTTWYD